MSSVINGKYKLGRLLGSGTFADVYMAKRIINQKNINQKDDKSFSLKKYNDKVIDHGIAQDILREIAVLKSCNHPNIVQLLDIDYLNFSYIILEYHDFTLSEIIQNNYSSLPFDKNHVQHIFYQILHALQYLHANNIIHRDVKASNILLSYYSKKNYYRVAIADLGSARVCHSIRGDKTPNVVTLWERPPEILKGGCKNYTAAVDIWSLGCTMAYVVRGKYLFTAETELHMLQQIYNLCASDKDDTLFIKPINNDKKLEKKFGNCDKVLTNLIIRMLRINPAERITASHALGHPYFINLHFSTIHQLNDKPYYQINYKRSYVKIRVSMINWLLGVMYRYELPIDVYLLTVKVLDRYLMTLTGEVIAQYTFKDWHTIVLTCFWIADKIEEINPFSLDALSDISLEEIDDYTIISMETQILRVLNCNIYCLLLSDYTDHMDNRYTLNRKQRAIRDFLIYYSSFSLTLSTVHPKQVLEAIYLYVLGRYRYHGNNLIINTNDNNDDIKLLTTCLEKVIELVSRDIKTVVGKDTKTKLVKFKGYKYLYK